MKKALVFASLALASPGTAEDAVPPSSAVVRATFVVRDIDRSVAFYRDVFGYSVRYDGRIGANPANRQLLSLRGKEDARFVILDGERRFSGRDHEAVGIGLMAVSGRKTPRLRQPRGNRLAGGQAMLAVMTSDIDTVIARLRARGAPILAGPVVGHGGAETEIVTSDPDGTRIHVVEQREP